MIEYILKTQITVFIIHCRLAGVYFSIFRPQNSRGTEAAHAIALLSCFYVSVPFGHNWEFPEVNKTRRLI